MLSSLAYPFQQNKWYAHGNVSVIGWAFNEKENMLKEEKLAEVFQNIASEDHFKQKLQSLNGHFAVVIEKEDFKAAAVDHIRSFPIIYSLANNDFKIIDVNTIEKQLQLNDTAVKEFQKCWCTLGNNTLINDVFQLQAGQYIYKKSEEATQPKFYYHHLESKKNRAVDPHVATHLIENVFKNYMPLMEGKTALVPLSGGYDSRLILTMLHRLKHTKVMAYTYGKKNSHEVQLAQKVAQQLNVQWHFIEYDEELFKSFFTNEWNDYSKANHFLSSLPHEQDFFALSWLKQNKLLPKDFVALPGYCGDLLGGSITANKSNDYTVYGLEDLIKRKHFQGDALSFNLEANIGNQTEFYDEYQHWFVGNKVSKFIVNSVRVYEYFGGSWMMPLWDKKLIEYWYQVPYEKREQQKFYNDVLFSFFFKPLNIDYKKPGFDDNYPNQIKEKIKEVLPNVVTKLIQASKKSIQPNDAVNLSLLSKMIQEKLEVPNVEETEINNSHANYFLQNLKK